MHTGYKNEKCQRWAVLLPSHNEHPQIPLANRLSSSLAAVCSEAFLPLVEHSIPVSVLPVAKKKDKIQFTSGGREVLNISRSRIIIQL